MARADMDPDDRPVDEQADRLAAERADEHARWRAKRSADAAAQAARAEQARVAESRRARELLVGFVAELRRRGIAPHELRATDSRGRSFSTGVQGWYLRENRSLGLDADAGFYILTVTLPWTTSVRSRFQGLTVHPSDPPLQIGRGARDGESVALPDLLALRLAELTTPDHP